ncbi:MAG: hypothetical protein JW816_00905 [Candidatus Buchananbacteria bacterium]|nr:hypothetical protein [Candidatus Buchananbacteria bacterium]
MRPLPIFKKTSFYFLALLIGFSFFISPAEALTIFSPVVELATKPGVPVNGIVKIYNETNQAVSLRSSVELYRGSQSVKMNSILPADFLGWFKVSQPSLVLQAKQAIFIPFTVNVPAKTTPGGYYAVIYWQPETSTKNQTGDVGVSSKVGTTVFLRVEGDIVESLDLTDFNVYPLKPVYFSLPINFNVSLKNAGNIHLQPTGTIEIKNWLGSKTLTFNQTKNFILPDNNRQFGLIFRGSHNQSNIFSQFISDLTDFGPAEATLTIAYGQEKPQTISKTIYFWLVPVKAIVGLVIILILLVIFLVVNKKINILKKGATKK